MASLTRRPHSTIVTPTLLFPTHLSLPNYTGAPRLLYQTPRGTLRHRHIGLPLHTASTNIYIHHSNVFGLCTLFWAPTPLCPSPTYSPLTPTHPYFFHIFRAQNYTTKLHGGTTTAIPNTTAALQRFAHHQHTPLILLKIPTFFIFVSTSCHISFFRVEPKGLTTGSKVRCGTYPLRILLACTVCCSVRVF
jgi:hypothetical protein